MDDKKYVPSHYHKKITAFLEHPTPNEAIKLKCLECCCWQPKEVELCEIKACPLLVIRKLPKRKIKLSDKARMDLTERLRAMRKRKLSEKTGEL